MKKEEATKISNSFSLCVFKCGVQWSGDKVSACSMVFKIVVCLRQTLQSLSQSWSILSCCGGNLQLGDL